MQYTFNINSKEDLKSAFEQILNNLENPVSEVNYVDLGLPSGTKWADSNAEGFFTFDEAVEKFGNALPSAIQMAELAEVCDWEYDQESKGYIVTGPNGNCIFLPVTGFMDYSDKKVYAQSYGHYWTRTPNANKNASEAYSYSLYFYSGDVYPLSYNYRAYGFAVRPVQE